jgi:hypothetical protein
MQMELISANFAAASPVVPGASDLIQFILVAAVACIGIAGVRLVLGRRAMQLADSAGQPHARLTKRRRRFGARSWAAVGGSTSAYGSAMLAGSIARGNGVELVWVAFLVVGLGCIAWSSRLWRHHRQPSV